MDIMLNEVAAFKAEKRKFSQDGNGRRKKKRKLEVLVNWGEKIEVRPLQDDREGDIEDMEAERMVSVDMTVSVPAHRKTPDREVLVSTPCLPVPVR